MQAPSDIPLGVRLTLDVETVLRGKIPRYAARVRWTDPSTHRRRGFKRMFDEQEHAHAWLSQMESVARTGVDPGQRLSDYVTYIGDRWSRGIDPTSTYDPYSAGLRLRVIPALGHLPVTMITAGVIDRAIDRWERDHGRSTVKNTVAPLVLVLDEAVRDGLIARNPAKDRARRRAGGRSFGSSDFGAVSPRDLALPDVFALNQLVERVAVAGNDQCWGDMVTILATTALRISEVSGLQVGDVDLVRGLLHVERQTYPGRGGLITKQTKGRRRRVVPIIDPLRGTLVRLTIGRPSESRLLNGPRGGVITTATLRDATHWDELVKELGLPGLVRHGLRHTALTWMADAGVPLHVLQRVAGHQDPAVTSRYLHPDVQAMLDAGAAFSAWWSPTGPQLPGLTLIDPAPGVREQGL